MCPKTGGLHVCNVVADVEFSSLLNTPLIQLLTLQINFRKEGWNNSSLDANSEDVSEAFGVNSEGVSVERHCRIMVALTHELYLLLDQARG